MESLCYSYGHSFFRAELKEFAKRYLACLPRDVTCLLTRGSSGCSIASAMIALSDRGLHHVHVKKSEEVGHSNYAGLWSGEDVVAVVDDFVDTGATIEALEKWAVERHIEVSYILLCHCPAFSFGGRTAKVIEVMRRL